MKSRTDVPTHETILDLAVSLGVRAVEYRGPCPEAIAHLLLAAIEMACDHASDIGAEPGDVLHTVDADEAEREYRRAYADGIGITADDLHRDLGWYPSELPLLDDMPLAFITRVARMEAAQYRARAALALRQR